MGWSESISLTSRIFTLVADGELPVDPGAACAGGPVDELPVHGGAGGLPVTTMSSSHSMPAVAPEAVIGRAVTGGAPSQRPCRCSLTMAGVVLHPAVVAVCTATVARVADGRWPRAG